MFLAAVAIATAMPVALGLLVVCRNDRHAIGWLLVPTDSPWVCCSPARGQSLETRRFSSPTN
jgi:hypothetical protein